MVIIDSPGLGESDQMDQVLMNYLPNAFAFIYVIDVSHAGGMHDDLKKKVKYCVDVTYKLLFVIMLGYCNTPSHCH